jgi:dipeptidyl-peptidase-4
MLFALVATLAVALTSLAPTPPAALTVEEIVSTHPVSGVVPSGFTWSPDGSQLVYSVAAPVEKAPPTMRIYRVRDGRDRVLFSARSETRGSRSRAIAQVVWSPDSRSLAFVDGGALMIADAATGRERRIADDVDDPQWSPDSRRVAYVHAGDLYARELASGTVTRLTTGGSALVSAGDPDWLYSEELDVSHAFAWSPRGDAIAYLRFDDAPVRAFPIEDWLATNPRLIEQRYPLAGAANPRVSLRVATLRGGSRMLYDGAPHDEYVLAPQWLPSGRAVLAQVLDRPQRTKRLLRFATMGGAPTTIVREHDARFVEVSPPANVLPDGSLLWVSPNGARSTLWHIAADGSRKTAIALGGPAISVERVDVHAGVAYVSARVPTLQNRSLLRVPLGGGAATVVTAQAGWHRVTLPLHGDAYVDAYSSLTTPPSIAVRRLSGGTSTVLFRTPSLAAYALGSSRAVSIPSRWGPLPAVVTTPPNFDSTRRYPVILQPYGGPVGTGDTRTADDAWPGLFTHVLAEHGYIVLSIDGPASLDPHLFAGQPGTIAMDGQLAAVDWLRAQSYVDAHRLGIWGWSFGGYLTAFTLTHAPGVFRSGIAGAPVVDWRLYDSAYTERYLGTPQQNADAYARASALNRAGDLRSRLLVIQGSADDNVHLTNSVSLLDALIAKGRMVDYMLYPNAQHGPRRIDQRRDLDRRMLEWWDRTL